MATIDRQSLFDDLPSIPGLICIPDFVNESRSLLATVDRMPWLDDLSRRVQHYGWRYDYKSRTIPCDAYLGPLPGFLQDAAEELFSAGLLKCVPDQAIVNEYLPGLGMPHISTASLASGPKSL